MTAPTNPLLIPVREDWLARNREPAIEPDLPIVDAHHHLWDRVDSRYLFDDLLADMNAGHDVRATVFVQAGAMHRRSGPAELQPIGEIEFANGVAAQAASGTYGRRYACAAIVGRADLTLGDRVEPVLAAAIAAGNGRLRGIRYPVSYHPHDAVRVGSSVPPRGVLLDPAFQEGARRLARHRLALDVWAYHTQLGEVDALARAAPGTTVVLDHVGGPIGVGPYAGRHDETFAEWRRGMVDLARHPNVVVKLGGLGMRVSGSTFHERAAPPTSEELATTWRPYIATTLELFGTKRCLFESNFPVDKGMFSYGVMWNAFKRLAAGASGVEKTALFSGTAMAVYRLNPADLE